MAAVVIEVEQKEVEDLYKVSPDFLGLVVTQTNPMVGGNGMQHGFDEVDVDMDDEVEVHMDLYELWMDGQEDPVDISDGKWPVCRANQFVCQQGRSGKRRVKRFGGSYDMDSPSWHDSGIEQERAQRKSQAHLLSHQQDLSDFRDGLLPDDDDLDLSYPSELGRLHGTVELPPNANFIPSTGHVDVVQGDRVRRYHDGRLVSDFELDDEKPWSRRPHNSNRTSSGGIRQGSRGNSRGGGGRRRGNGGSSVRQVTFLGSRGRQRSKTIFG